MVGNPCWQAGKLVFFLDGHAKLNLSVTNVNSLGDDGGGRTSFCQTAARSRNLAKRAWRKRSLSLSRVQRNGLARYLRQRHASRKQLTPHPSFNSVSPVPVFNTFHLIPRVPEKAGECLVAR